jgi:DHA1 family multidrug resistance protein-like MFS transporter
MNRSLLWLGISLFLWGIGEAMFMLFQPIYMQQLGADPIQIGGILGAFGFVMMMVHIPSGHLSDRIGRRPLLIAAWIVGIVATLFMGFARTLPFFIAGWLMYGFTAFVASPLDSYVTAARGKWSVGRAITFTGFTFNAGAVLGPVTGGWIGDHYGLRTVFFISTILFVISLVVLFFVEAQPIDSRDSETPPASLRRNTRFLGFIGVYFFIVVVLYLPQPLTPNFLQNVRGLSLSEIGMLGSIGGIGNTSLNFLLGFLEARLGFLLGQLGVAAFALLIWKGTGFWQFGLAYFFLGGYRVLRGLGVALVRPLVHEAQMGLAYGMAETIGSTSSLIAPVIAGFLYDRDPALIYPVGLAAIAVVFVLSIIFVPRADHVEPVHVDIMPE